MKFGNWFAVLFALILVSCTAFATAPEVAIIQPNGGELISGNYEMQFKVKDVDYDALRADIYYSESQGAFENKIVENLDLEDAQNCDDPDHSNATDNNCFYLWDASSLEAGSYFIDVNVFDINESAADSSMTSFTVDNDAPEFQDVSPENDSIVGDARQQIVASVAEEFTEIDANSVFMKVEGVKYTADDPELSFIQIDAKHGTITFTPSSDFENEQEVNVRAVTEDFAGNKGAINFKFYVDLAGPVVSNADPSDGQYINQLDKNISFVLSDELSEVDWSTLGIEHKVNGAFATFTYEYDAVSGEVTLNPDEDYLNNATISLYVYAQDSFGNLGESNWSFGVDTLVGSVTDLYGFSGPEGNIFLDWSEPSNEGAAISHYKLYKSNYPIVDENKGSPIATLTETEYRDYDVVLYNYYYYAIEAVDTLGNVSNLSNYVRVQSYTDAELQISYEDVYLEAGQTINTTVSVRNASTEQICFTIKTDSHNDEVSAEILGNEFCLSAGQATEVTLTVIAESSADEGTYEVELEFEYNDVERFRAVNVHVLGSEDIDFEGTGTTYRICKTGYTKYIDLEITNNTSVTQEVELTADDPLLIPTFDPSEIRLYAGETRNITLVFHINTTTELGLHTIDVFARTDDFYLEREVLVDLYECEDNPFTVAIATACKTLDNNESIDISFTVYNNLDEEQEVWIGVDSDLAVDLNATKLKLDANDSNRSYITVTGRLNDTNGEHTVDFYVWNSKGEVEKELCFRISEDHNILIEVLNNGVESVICSAQDLGVFEVLITNIGDHTETVYLSTENRYDSIDAEISDDEFELEAGESKTVYVAVNPSFDTPFGNKKIYLIATTEEFSDSDQMLEVTLDNFKYDIRKSSIELTVDNQKYTMSSSRLDFNSDSGLLEFDPSKTYDRGDVLKMKLEFRDDKGNKYKLQAKYRMGYDIYDLNLAIIADDFSYSIDDDEIEFMFDGEWYDIDDHELKFESSVDRITLDVDENFNSNETLEFELRLADSSTHTYELDGEFKIKFKAEPEVEERAELYFSVVESVGDDLIEGVLEITNFPRVINMSQGEEQRVAITVRNNSSANISTVRVNLWGETLAAYFPSVTIPLLEAGESRTVYGNLKIKDNAPSGDYEITFETKTDKYIATAGTKLSIRAAEAADGEDEPEGPVEAFIAGLAIFAGSGLGSGLGLMILIVIVAVIIIGYAAGASRTRVDRKQPWVADRNQ